MIMMVKPEYIARLLVCPRSRESFKKKLAKAQTFPIPFLFVFTKYRPGNGKPLLIHAIVDTPQSS
jgi:hypothetical protein